MRDTFAKIMEAMREIRDGDDALIMSIGSLGPSPDCRNGSHTVTVSKGGVTETSEAVHLHDALLLARAKVAATIEREAKAREKAKQA